MNNMLGYKGRILSRLKLFAIYALFERLSKSLQRKSSCFGKAFDESQQSDTLRNTIWQLFSITIRLDFKNPWKWKWSNEVEKSEMSMIWCISITNNVKSYKKLNEIAQTARFTVFTMCGSWKSWFLMKTSQTESHFWPLYTLVWLFQG